MQRRALTLDVTTARDDYDRLKVSSSSVISVARAGGVPRRSSEWPVGRAREKVPLACLTPFGISVFGWPAASREARTPSQ